MSDLATAVFVITGLTASWAYLTWWILKPPKRRSQICDFCDIEGPIIPGPFFTSYELLDLHRAIHKLGRELMKPLHKLFDRITGYRKGGHANPPRSEDYEPTGIIHNGSFTFQDYYAEATPNGTYHVWHDDEYLGEYHGQRIEIVEQLHAKDQK